MPPITTPTQEAQGVVAFKVKANGNELRGATGQSLQSVEFESTYNRPDLCIVTFLAAEVSGEKPLPPVQPGHSLDCEVTRPGGAVTSIFKGDISSIELEGRTGSTLYILRAYDKRQRLYRGVRSRVFTNVTHGEAVNRVFAAAEVDVSIEAIPGTVPYLAQRAVSDGDFVEQLLHEAGFVSLREGDRISCKPLHQLKTEVATLEFGNNLESYRFRSTAESWTSKVEYTDWDAAKKKEIIEAAQDGRVAVGEQKLTNGDGLGAATITIPRVVQDPATAKARAQADYDRALAGSRQLDGTCDGNEKLTPGALVKIKGIDATFNGLYRLSMVRHRWEPDTGFLTEFACNGTEASITNLLANASDGIDREGDVHRAKGVAPAVVTDTNDPEDLGRIKVKYPWMPATEQGEFESHWVRLTLPGAGAAQKGLYLVPEVNDEVLVAFEHGDFRRGYVLGGLYSTADKPPLPKREVVKNGATPQKLFRSTKGHVLAFNDSDDKPGVDLITATKKLKVHLDDKKGDITVLAEQSGTTVTVTADGDVKITSKSGGIVIEAMKDITMKAKGNIKLEAVQDVEIKGLNATMKGTTSATVEAATNAVVKAATVDVKGQGMTNITGGMVKIN